MKMVQLSGDSNHKKHFVFVQANGVAIMPVCGHVSLKQSLSDVCASEGKPKPSEMCEACADSLNKIYFYTRGMVQALKEGEGT